MKTTLSLISFVLILSGCASALKKQCESQDWSDYGREKGEAGIALSSDTYPDQCAAEGVTPNRTALSSGHQAGVAKFCTPASFQAAGAKGDPRSPQLCPIESSQALMSAHQKGLNQHCSKQGAFARGKSGAANPKTCPASMQANYNVYYSQGRAAYFSNEITSRKKRILAIDGELETLHQKSQKLLTDLAEAKRLEAKKDSSWGTTLSKIAVGSSSSIETDLSSNGNSIRVLNEEKVRLTTEVAGLELEVSKATTDGTEIPSGSLESSVNSL